MRVEFELQSDLGLDIGYLRSAPVLRCWRHGAGPGDLVTLRQFSGAPARLEVSVPAAEFFAAVEDFDRRFLAAMGERVALLERIGPPDGIDLDVGQLRLEHQQRSSWLEQRLSVPRVVDWDRVRAGVAEVASWAAEDL